MIVSNHPPPPAGTCLTAHRHLPEPRFPHSLLLLAANCSLLSRDVSRPRPTPAEEHTVGLLFVSLGLRERFCEFLVLGSSVYPFSITFCTYVRCSEYFGIMRLAKKLLKQMQAYYFMSFKMSFVIFQYPAATFSSLSRIHFYLLHLSHG